MNKSETDQPPSLASIQIMRALAALSVCLGHALHECSHLPHGPFIAGMMEWPFEIGVDLFFIISGFIMMFTSAATFNKPNAPQAFALRRLIRIVPPYWFFTTLMVAATLLLADKLDSAHFSPSHAALSYLFIPHAQEGISDGIHPILSVGWTLLYEMFFYLVFSLALFFPRKTGLGLLALSFTGLFAAARAGLWSATYNEFWGDTILFEFILGIVASLIFAAKTTARRKSALMVGLAAVLYGVAWLAGVEDERLFRYGMPALAFFGIVGPLKVPHKALWAALVFIGDASYTLYLSHPFSIEVVKQVLTRLFSGALEAAWFVPFYLAACVGISVIGAGIFFVLCEKPVTKRLRILFSKAAPTARK